MKDTARPNRGRTLVSVLCLVAVIGVAAVALVVVRSRSATPEGAAGDTPYPVPTSAAAPLEVAGAAAGSAASGHDRMVALLKQIGEQMAVGTSYYGSGQARMLRAQLAALPVDAPAAARWELCGKLGDAELGLGNEQSAILQFSQARQLLPQVKGVITAEGANWTLFRQGVAYTRLGETQNCCLRHTAESCILPVRGGGIHTQKEGASQAAACFMEVLRRTGPRDRLHLEARWLLNIAHMTLGTYPQKVPDRYLIPPSAFRPDEKIPHFANIAPDLRLDTFDLSGGAIADDFDNDGYLDIVVSTSDPLGQMHFFRSNQDGTFSDRTKQAGLTGLLGGLNMVQADYDNDGDVDIYVLRGGWLYQHGQMPDSLLRNNGDGTFRDVTFEAGLGEGYYPSQTGSWADYDNDGDLDLYVGNETSQVLSAPCQLFRNNGNGTFTDVAATAGVQNNRLSKGVIWGDYDGDRRPDLYVSNYRGENRLYHNNGDGTFTDVAPQLHVTRPIVSFPAWFWDFDNDGALDLYVHAFSADIADVAAGYLGLRVKAEPACLYRGNGRGGFEEVSKQNRLTRPHAVMGSNFGDLDNDGFLDCYLGTGLPDYKELMPKAMYRNRRGKGFADVTFAGGLGHLQKGHGVAFADLDNDGDQDIFEQMGGAYPGDKYGDVLYENPGFGNRWIGVKLVGTRSNRSGVGARIHVEVLEDGGRRSIYKHVNSGGSFGCNPLRQTIGLGKAAKIELLEVFWPTSGLTQTFRDVPAEQFIRIVEGEREYTTFKLKRLKLGGSRPGSQAGRRSGVTSQG